MTARTRPATKNTLVKIIIQMVIVRTLEELSEMYDSMSKYWSWPAYRVSFMSYIGTCMPTRGISSGRGIACNALGCKLLVPLVYKLMSMTMVDSLFLFCVKPASGCKIILLIELTAACLYYLPWMAIS